MKYEKVALIGIGNIMFYDEGLGAYVVDFISKNYNIPKNLKIIEGGTLGFTLMTYMQEYDKLIIVGTGSKDGEVGSITSENADEVMAHGPIRKTANEVEINMMIEICSFHEDMGDVQFITMVPEDILEVKLGLTDKISSCIPNLVEVILEELKTSGMAIKKKTSNLVSLKQVLYDYDNPRINDYREEN